MPWLDDLVQWVVDLVNPPTPRAKGTPLADGFVVLVVVLGIAAVWWLVI